MECDRLMRISCDYLALLVIPGNASGHFEDAEGVEGVFVKQMVNLNKAFIASVVLSTISGVALLRTSAQTTANHVFKAGFAGFGTLAALIALFGVVKLYQLINHEDEDDEDESMDTIPSSGNRLSVGDDAGLLILNNDE